MLNVLSLLAALIASPGADLVPDAYAQDGAKTYNLKGLLSKDREEKQSFKLMAELFSKELAPQPDGPR